MKRLEGGKPQAITPEGVAPPIFHMSIPVSPDGRWVAASAAGEKPMLFPVEGGTPLAVLGVADGELALRFGGDGRSLYVWKNDQLPARVFRIELDTGRRSLWKELMPADPVGVTRIRNIHLTPDGTAYVYTYERLLSDLYVVDGLMT